ncbi:MAG: hypothetical protein ACE5KE_08475 [Methanosarcinales archaeon]
MKGTVDSISHEYGIEWKKAKKWIESNDPEYDIKKERVIDLYNEKPDDGIVLCIDEKGPIAIKHYGGSTWSKENKKIAKK